MQGFIKHDQNVLLPAAAAVILLLVAVMLRSVHGAFIIMINAILVTIWTKGLMVVFGIPNNMLNNIVPALILVVGSAEGIHILTEFKEALAKGKRGLEAISSVDKNVGTIIFLTAGTTVLSFISNALSDMPLMKDFGFASGIAMALCLLVSAFFLPAYLRFFGWIFYPKKKSNTEVASEHTPADEGHGGHEAVPVFAQKIAHAVISTLVPRRVQVFIVFGIVAMVTLAMIPSLRVSNDMTSFLDGDVPIIKNLVHVSGNMAGTKVMYITLEGNKEDFKQASNLKVVSDISTWLRQNKDFDTVLSLADILALVNREMLAEPEAYKVPDSTALISQYLLLFHRDQISTYVTGDFSKANIIVRCNINDSALMNHYVEGIRTKLNSGDFGHLRFTISGKAVMVSGAVSSLVEGQVSSLTFASVILFLVIAGMFISLKLGCMSLIPNLFPIIIVFGLMALGDIPLNVGTCMIATISLGITVNDTIILMIRYNQELKQDKNESSALEKTMKAEVYPCVITSVALCGGFLVLSLSSFIPIRQFGALSALVMAIGVLTDIFLTPTLLSTTRIITLWDIMSLNLRQKLMECSVIFEDMTAWQAKKLILASQMMECPAGTTVIKAGDTGNTMYVVLEGELEVSVLRGEMRTVLTKLGIGEVVGEVALVSRMLRTADVIALTPVRLLVYDWESFVQLKRFSPFLASKLLLNLAKILGTRLVSMQKRLES